MSVDRLKGVGKDVEDLSLKAVQKVEGATGLKVGDAVRRGQEKVEVQSRKLENYVAQSRDRPVERVGYVVEQKPVAEIVRPVEEIKPAQPEAKRMV